MTNEMAMFAESLGIGREECSKICRFFFKNQIEEAIQYVQDVAKCDLETATKIVADFTEDLTMPTPEERARDRAYAYRLEHGPKCPNCQSINIRKITALDKLSNISIYGIYGELRNSHRTLYLRCTSNQAGAYTEDG